MKIVAEDIFKYMYLARLDDRHEMPIGMYYRRYPEPQSSSIYLPYST